MNKTTGTLGIAAITCLVSTHSGNVQAQESETASSADSVICEVGGMRETNKKENAMSEYNMAAFESSCKKGNIIYLNLQFGRSDFTEIEVSEFVRRYCSFEHQIYTFNATWQGATFGTVSCVYRGSPRKAHVAG